MTRFAIIAATLVLLAGCASDPKPAVCDGKHRRPANPYGSVLPSVPATGAAPPSHLAPPPPSPPVPPGPQSSLDPQSLAPCGARI